MDGQLLCLHPKMVTLMWWKGCLQMGPNLISRIRYAAWYDSCMSKYAPSRFRLTTLVVLRLAGQLSCLPA